MSYLSVGAISRGGGGGVGPSRAVKPRVAGGLVTKAKPLFATSAVKRSAPSIMTAPPGRGGLLVQPAKRRSTAVVPTSVLATSTLATTAEQIAPSIYGGGGGGGGFATATDPVMADLDEDETDLGEGEAKKGKSPIILLALGAGVLYLLMK